MIKTIINPGNGYTYPTRGEYVKVKIEAFNIEKKILFNNLICIRIDYDTTIKPEIMNLIKDMTLLEKCSLEMDVKDSIHIPKYNNNINENMVIYEIELLAINNIPIIISYF